LYGWMWCGAANEAEETRKESNESSHSQLHLDPYPSQSMQSMIVQRQTSTIITILRSNTHTHTHSQTHRLRKEIF